MGQFLTFYRSSVTQFGQGDDPYPIRREERSELNDAAAHGDRDSLGAVVGAQLFHDKLDMNLDSLLGYEEEIRDIAIAISSRDLPKDIDLADCPELS